MTLKRKIIFWFYMICLLTPVSLYASESTPPSPKVDAKGAVLVEKDSMRILWEKDANQPLPMASTTKIMTCLLALEKGNMEDVVTASQRAAAAPKVKLYLKVGEKQTLEDLLYALMLQSSNDAAVAIAEHIGGSVEAFCNQMTQRAKELGAKQTVFKTPNGLDAPGHVASPYDLAIIAKHAYDHPEFLKIIQTPGRQIPSKPLEGSRPHQLQNKNRFLTSFNGANGIKTGYTGQAGHCFAGGAKQNDMQLFAVVLGSGWGPRGSKQKYTDTVTLMNYGFENYQMNTIKQAQDEAGTLPVVKGDQEWLPLVYGRSLTLPLTKEEEDKVSITLDIPQEIVAPVKISQPIGTARIYIKNSLVSSLPIIAAADIEQRTIKKSLEKTIRQWLDLLTE